MRKKEITPSAPVSLEKTAEMNEQLALSKYSSMSPTLRARVAASFQNIYGADSFTKVALWDYAPKARLGPHFKEAMQTRKTMLKSAGDLSASSVDTFLSGLSDQTPEEVAILLNTFDKLAGLDLRYKDGLLDPYRTCHAGHMLPAVKRDLEKQAAINSMQFGAPDMDVEDALRHLEGEYPRTSQAFSKMATAVRANYPLFQQEMSPAQFRAANMYFGISKTADMETEYDGSNSEVDADLASAESQRADDKEKHDQQKAAVTAPSKREGSRHGRKA